MICFVGSFVALFRWHEHAISSQVIGLPEKVSHKTFHNQKLFEVLMLKPTYVLCEKSKEVVVLNLHNFSLVLLLLEEKVTDRFRICDNLEF